MSKKTPAELLPDDLAWQGDGHVSDVTLTCIADGEERILPPKARDHAVECESCARRLGKAAMMSLSSSDAIQKTVVQAAIKHGAKLTSPRAEASRAAVSSPPASAETPRKATSRRPRAGLPLSAVAAALTLALLGAIPELVDMFAELPKTTASFTLALPVLARSVVVVLRTPEGGFGPVVMIVSWVSAVMLVAIGLVVARAASRSRAVSPAAVRQEGGIR